MNLSLAELASTTNVGSGDDDGSPRAAVDDVAAKIDGDDGKALLDVTGVDGVGVGVDGVAGGSVVASSAGTLANATTRTRPISSPNKIADLA